MTKLRSKQLNELPKVTVRKWQNLHSMAFSILCITSDLVQAKVPSGFTTQNLPRRGCVVQGTDNPETSLGFTNLLNDIGKVI